MPAPAPKLPKEPSKLYSVRLTESVVARSDRLLEPDAYTRLTPEMQRVMTSRAAIFRECLLRGLAAFEADLALEPMQLKRARRR
jgi:hypothetical protein